MHPCANLSNKVLKSGKLLVSNPKLSCQCVDGLLGRWELVLQPHAILGIYVMSRAHIVQ